MAIEHEVVKFIAEIDLDEKDKEAFTRALKESNAEAAKLRKTIAETEAAMAKLSAAGKKDSEEFKKLGKELNETKAKLKEGATLIVHEKIMTHGKQYARTYFEVDLDGEDCGTHVVSRSVDKDESKQEFISHVNGNNRSSGHTECDAIIMDKATVSAVPEIMANHPEASLIHEAAIGKIAGEQLIKLMTLGLTEKEAEEQIIGGFLK